MIWLAVVFTVLMVCVLAGRAHSRYLDLLEARSNLMMQLLSLMCDNSSRFERESCSVTEQDHQVTIRVSIGGQMRICPHQTYEARSVSL
jgi:hypothetical protein